MDNYAAMIAEVRAVLDEYNFKEYGTHRSLPDLVRDACRSARQRQDDMRRLEELSAGMRRVFDALEAASRAMFVCDRKTMRARLSDAYKIADALCNRIRD